MDASCTCRKKASPPASTGQNDEVALQVTPVMLVSGLSCLAGVRLNSPATYFLPDASVRFRENDGANERRPEIVLFLSERIGVFSPMVGCIARIEIIVAHDFKSVAMQGLPGPIPAGSAAWHTELITPGM